MKKLCLLFFILVSLNATEVKDTVVIQENVVKDSQLINSTVRQGDINIVNSTIHNSVFGKAGDKNEIKNSTITDSSVSQGTVDINNSTVLRTNVYSTNEIVQSTIENNSSVIQGTLTMESGSLEDSRFELDNSITGAFIRQSSVSQSEIIIDSSSVKNLILNETHSIEDMLGSVTIEDSQVTQGKLSVIDNSTLDNAVITLQSSIDNTNITNSNVDLCSVYISNGATVSGQNISETCSLSNMNIHNAILSVGVTTIN